MPAVADPAPVAAAAPAAPAPAAPVIAPAAAAIATPPAPIAAPAAKVDAPAAPVQQSLLADAVPAKVEATTGEAAPAAAPAKTGEAAPAAEAWKLKLDGAKAEDIAAFEKHAREDGLTEAQAQKRLERETAASAAQSAAAKAKAESDYKALYDTWGADLKKHPEIGGEKLPASLDQAKRALRTFATAEERAFLEATPFGNHPVLVAILARAGARMSEDGFVAGGSNPPPAKTAAQIAYGADHSKPSSFR